MASQLRKATRQKAKIRLGLAAPSGSGKTYSALLIAKGLVGDWGKVVVIDTENGSADLYSHLGDYNVLTLTAPFSPERYIEAIRECEEAGVEVIIVDSVTHEWNGRGGCLDMHEQAMQKQRVPNSFTAWAEVTPRHQSFIDALLQSKCHIITTVRSKSDYVLTEKNGKQVPQKVGMAAQTRDGFEFELTVSFDVDIDHKAHISKDRTGLFADKPAFTPTEETGQLIREWCESGVDLQDDVRLAISRLAGCDSVAKLSELKSSLSALVIDNEDFKRAARLQFNKVNIAATAALT